MSSPSDWQVMKQKVIQRGQHIMETGQWSDCKFIVGQEPHQQILEGHKLFLAMSSPVFEAMFFGDMPEKKSPIPVRDVHPTAFKALLEYIYTDNIDLSSFESACELSYCAKKYMLPFLFKECTKFLGSNVSPKTACRAYELAKLFEEPVLMEKCLQIICTKTNSVLSEPSFEEIEVETLEMIFDQTKLEINSEIELFSAAKRWARSECSRKGLDPENGKSLRSVIGKAWTKIRFLTLTSQEFAEGPATSSLLTKEEAFAIFMNLSSSESKWPMPDGFSTNAQSRNRLTDRYKCQIPFSYHPRDAFFGTRVVSQSSIAFSVNKDITVIGIEVPTLPTANLFDKGSDRSFDAQLVDSNGSKLSEKRFVATACNDSSVEITFDRPVDIQRNKVYYVKLVLKYQIRYRMASCAQQMTCSGVLFSFRDDYRQTNYQAPLIRSIIFTYSATFESSHKSPLNQLNFEMSSPSNWQVTKQRMVERGKHILQTSQWSDCKFIVGQEPHQQILEGHKLFLAMASPVFEAMFFGDMAEKNDPIPISDVQPEAFKALLEYIYTDNIDSLLFELAFELCYCAKKYMLPFLVEECTKFLGSNVSPKTACRACELAKLLDEPVLMIEFFEIICTKTNSVLSEPNFKEIELGTLEMVFDQTKLKIDSEIELFSAAERWARAECSRKGLDPEDSKSLRSVIGNALTKIRFLTLTPQEFAEGPARSSLLTKDEAFAILMNITCEKKCPMPDGFSTNTQSRVRLTDRYDCQLPLSPLTNPISRNIAGSCLSLTVNKNITVIGVEVLTGNSFYNESSFDTQLLDPNGLVLTGKNCAVPDHQSYVEVMFDRPVDIQRNKVYRIEVHFECLKQYDLTPYLSQTICGPVLFSLGVGNDTSNSRESVIRSIIFRY